MSIIKHAIALALGIALSRVFIYAGTRLLAVMGFTLGLMQAEGSVDLFNLFISDHSIITAFNDQN